MRAKKEQRFLKNGLGLPQKLNLVSVVVLALLALISFSLFLQGYDMSLLKRQEKWHRKPMPFQKDEKLWFYHERSFDAVFFYPKS